MKFTVFKHYRHYPKQEHWQAGPVSGKTQLIHQQFRHRLDCAIHSCTAFTLGNYIGKNYSDRSSLQDHLQLEIRPKSLLHNHHCKSMQLNKQTQTFNTEEVPSKM